MISWALLIDASSPSRRRKSEICIQTRQRERTVKAGRSQTRNPCKDNEGVVESSHTLHGPYRKLKPFSTVDFSKTKFIFQGPFVECLVVNLFTTMNHYVRTKLANIYGQNSTFQEFCCKTNTNTTLQLRNVKPAPRLLAVCFSFVFYTRFRSRWLNARPSDP